MKWPKNFIISLLIIAANIIPISSVHAEDAIRVFLQGEKLKFDVDPIVVNGTTMVQFRPIFEKLGLQITWDEKTKKISGKKTDLVIDMIIGSKSASINNQRKELEVVPIIVDGNTMVPLRFISEASGKVVKWFESGRYIEISKGIEKTGTYKPYAGESYLELDYATKFPANMQPYIYESNGYVYAIWAKEDQFQNKPVTNFFVSVAKDGKWIVKNQLLSHQKKDIAGVKYSYFYENGSIYWRDEKGIMKITPSESGFSGDGYLAQIPSTTDSETMAPVYINGEMGLLYSKGDNYRIYTPGSQNYIEVKDIFKVLPSGKATSKYIYSPDNRILYIFNDAGYKQLNIDSGDLVYGLDGKDKITTISDTAQSNAIKMFYKGILYYLYVDGQDRSYKLGYFGKDLKYEVGLPTQINTSELLNKQIVITDSELRVWSSSEFERRPVLELTSFSR